MKWGLLGVLLCLANWPAFAKDHLVRIISDYENLRFAFEPASLVIEAGDTVTWVNDVEEEHNVITYPGGFPAGALGFQSPYLTKPGEEYSVSFLLPGTYQYHCLPHLLMGMRGEIIVERRSEVEEFHIPSRDEVMAYRAMLHEWFDEEDNLFQVRIDDKGKRPLSAHNHGH